MGTGNTAWLMDRIMKAIAEEVGTGSDVIFTLIGGEPNLAVYDITPDDDNDVEAGSCNGF